MTRVKICGIKRIEDALTAAEAGADLLGFVFAPSRRRITPEWACRMIQEVRGRSTARTVGVFVNADPTEMNRIARLCGLDYVQLSGDEPDEIVRALEVPAIQVFHVRPEVSPEELAEQAGGTSAELVLLDTAATGAYGGTGAIFDWSRVPDLRRPVMVAGGLHAGNVAEAIRIARPWGVDVSSGVERDGEKDPDRIRAFIRAVQSLAGTRTSRRLSP